jgi:hypothetical protein
MSQFEFIKNNISLDTKSLNDPSLPELVKKINLIFKSLTNILLASGSNTGKKELLVKQIHKSYQDNEINDVSILWITPEILNYSIIVETWNKFGTLPIHVVDIPEEKDASFQFPASGCTVVALELIPYLIKSENFSTTKYHVAILDEMDLLFYGMKLGFEQKLWEINEIKMMLTFCVNHSQKLWAITCFNNNLHEIVSMMYDLISSRGEKLYVIENKNHNETQEVITRFNSSAKLRKAMIQFIKSNKKQSWEENLILLIYPEDQIPPANIKNLFHKNKSLKNYMIDCHDEIKIQEYIKNKKKEGINQIVLYCVKNFKNRVIKQYKRLKCKYPELFSHSNWKNYLFEQHEQRDGDEIQSDFC